MARSCPHCLAENPDDAVFCGACGKAVPSLSATGPRVVANADQAVTGAGQRLRVEELDRQRRKAFGILLAVAILQALAGVLMLTLGGMLIPGRGTVKVLPAAYVLVLGLAVLFLALSIWARRSPLAAAIVGLVVFCTIHLADAMVEPRTLLSGIVMKIIIVVLLIQAITAGVRHREALRRQTTP